METHSDKFRYQTDWTFYLSLQQVGFSKSTSPNCKRKGITCVSAKVSLQGRQSLSGLRETMTCQRLAGSSRVRRMELKSDLPLHLYSVHNERWWYLWLDGVRTLTRR